MAGAFVRAGFSRTRTRGSGGATIWREGALERLERATQGNGRLLPPGHGRRPAPQRNHHRLELYHLKDDPGERSDLAAREPARAQALHAKLQAWRTEVGAQLPVPNPNYRP